MVKGDQMNQVPAGLPMPQNPVGSPGDSKIPVKPGELTPERWELAKKIITKAKFYRDRTKPVCRTMGSGNDLDRLLKKWDEDVAE